MMSVMNEGQLRRLAEHKYSAQCTTILDPYFQVYWRWLVQQVPLWLAPNTITFIGLLINVFTSLILMAYCPQAREVAPGWAFILCGVGLFVYQSLDAIDGKQARRTNSHSPLGELIDHGCDAVSMLMVILSFSIALQLGKDPLWMFFLCFCASLLFYCAHWQAYVSGTIKFGTIDVTELQVTAMLIFCMTGIFGTTFWMIQILLLLFHHLLTIFSRNLELIPLHKSEVPVLNVTLKQVILGIGVCGVFYTLFSIFSQIYEGGMGKNGSTIAGTSVVSPVIPIGVVLYMAYLTARTSSTNLFQRQPCLFVMAFGMSACKITIKLVVACMSKSPLEFKDATMLGGIIQILNIHYGSPFDEYLLLSIMLVHVLFDMCRYNVALCSQICNYLNISCFSITPKITQDSNSH